MVTIYIYIYIYIYNELYSKYKYLLEVRDVITTIKPNRLRPNEHIASGLERYALKRAIRQKQREIFELRKRGGMYVNENNIMCPMRIFAIN